MYRVGPTLLAAVAVAAGASGALLTRWLDAPFSAAVPGAAVESWDEQSGPDPLPSFAGAVNRSAPAVVSIYAFRAHQAKTLPGAGSRYRYDPYGPPTAGRDNHETGLGSGVILTSDGLILTNRHVVKDASSIRVILANGRRLQASLLGHDGETDLAVLKADATGLSPAPIGDPKALRVGDVALAIGNPFGVGQTVTQGIISATGRAELGITPIENFIQTDAAINPGNSGGALINARGELVGINTAIYSESGASDGVGFAIPADLALKVARTIAASGKVERGWIGMSGRSVTPELAESFGLRAPGGVLVSSTLRDSPAEQAGLRPGDVVTRVDDREVASIQELLDAIAGAGPNKPVALEVWRGSERIRAQTVTEERPPMGRQ